MASDETRPLSDQQRAEALSIIDAPGRSDETDIFIIRLNKGSYDLLATSTDYSVLRIVAGKVLKCAQQASDPCPCQACADSLEVILRAQELLRFAVLH